ncbi:MAG: glutamine--fructose-6-phosphate transaminase (isomerizing) [Candidatus Brocadiia bacterium]
MCGIIGYIGGKRAVSVLLEALSRLEYRGYDSAGVALIEDNVLFVRRKVGRVANLAAALAEEGFTADVGIGHTRWATHGKPTERNAHPHSDSTGKIAVVHNGIIENAESLRSDLIKLGHSFLSETDTEVIPHLIEENIHLGLEDAVRASITKLVGAFALAIISEVEPDRIVAVRRGSPLVIGLGDNESFIASSVDAILPFTQRVIFLEDGQWASVGRERIEVFDRNGNPVVPQIHQIEWKQGEVGKEPYAHFMLKEIYEQPDVLRRLASERVQNNQPWFEEMSFKSSDLASVERIVVQACGTSWHAGLVGKYYLERMAGVHTDVEISSEFRYCEPILDAKTLVMAISQSGETADALEGLRLARAQAVRTMGIVNVENSTIAREAHACIMMRAGTETGVASTKAFTSEVALLFLLSLHLGRLRWRIRDERVAEYVESLRRLPALIDELLSDTTMVDKAAERIRDARHMFFIGRGLSYPIALEGALKMKEISYIHAAGIAAGELKHGPIALIEDGTPVVVVCPKDAVASKTISNAEEIKARGGFIIAIIEKGDSEAARIADIAIPVPACDQMIAPLLTVVPLQLLAYRVAVLLGRDVDKPRNLAKSVTVE